MNSSQVGNLLLLLLTVFGMTDSSVLAADLRGPLPQQNALPQQYTLPQHEPYSSTTMNEIEINNPIQLRIVKEAPGGDLPEITGSLSFSEAVQTGIKNNFVLRDSELSWLSSKFMARAALAKFGPAASLNTFYSSSSLNQMLFLPGDTTVASPPMQPIVKGNSISLIVAATQPIFTGGRLLGNYRAARAQERQSLSGFNDQRISTALKIKESYLNAVWNKARLRVANDNVKYRQWSSNNMKIRVEEGKSPRADFLREEAELAKAKVQVNERYRDFNIALLDLKVAMAVNLGSQFDLKDELAFVETNENLNTYLLASAKNRPEIVRAASKVNEIKAKKMVALSKYSPQINAYGLGSNITGSSPDGDANGRWGGFIGVVGGMTIFDSGSRLNELRAANVAVRQAELAQKNVNLKVAQEVSQAWIELELARSNVQLSQAEVTSAEEDHRLFRARYEVGKSIALEVFDAAVKMFQARLNLLESIYKYRLAQARLTFASGAL